MDKDFMLNYYDKMVRPIWTELMKTPRYQRVACERDKIEREFRRLLDEKLGRKYLELDDALFHDSRFRQLSTDARTLYGILLDRMSLPAPAAMRPTASWKCSLTSISTTPAWSIFTPTPKK